MADLSLQDELLLERVIDPSTAEFAEMLQKLMKPQKEDKKTHERFTTRSEFRHTLPYRGDPEDEQMIRERAPLLFSERGQFRNGMTSLALTAADLLDCIQQASNRRRVTSSVVVSCEMESLQSLVDSAGNASSLVYYCTDDNIIETFLQTGPETIVFDHTTINMPIDELLNAAYRHGIEVVDGVFPYHLAAMNGWDVVTGLGKWSYTHHDGKITIGPDDDCSRLITYQTAEYRKFVRPREWTGNAKKYGYEIRKCHNGLASYRAVFLGDAVVPEIDEDLSFNLPTCSSQDMVLLSINRELAAGCFASNSNNATDLSRAEKNYAIEVRRELFTTCVNYLMGRDKGADIVGESVRYISQHNYVDLVEGVRIVRCPSLGYADALCVSMVCALTAFSLRYRLTNESIPTIRRHKTAAKYSKDMTFGLLGRIAWLMGTYVSDAFSNVAVRAREAAFSMLENSDLLPGICYDVYMSHTYKPDLLWMEPFETILEPKEELYTSAEPDAFEIFLGGAEKTYAPTVEQKKLRSSLKSNLPESRYVHNIVPDPQNTLQHFYDEALPGNSVAQIQNVAELRRVRDVNINTEFYGKIEINKDIAAPEKLHMDASIRTAAIPISNTPLLDAVMASAKRNFNPPDIQQQNDPWAFARYLVDRFVDWAFIPNFRDTIAKSYKKDPISFNVTDYIEWKATRDGAYKSALEAECPEDMVELNLEKYDTMVKKRIKPKLTVAAQYELAQPQVIVSMSKHDTAPFTSIFRQIFRRFESALRPEVKSAGMASDTDISDWLTDFKHVIDAYSAIEIDAGKFDKSQNLLARMMESLLMQELGLDPGVSEIFEDSYVGRVSSRSLGLMFISAYQMKSGAPQTMLGNIIYNFISAMEAVGPGNIALMIAKGDDNILWLKPGANVDSAVNKMSSLFNLEIKLIPNSVLYFSSGYIVPVGDVYHFVPDVLKAVELLGEKGADPRTLPERFVSFSDRVRSITRDAAIPHVLQRIMRSRLGISDLDVVGAVDALACMAADFDTFKRVVA